MIRRAIPVRFDRIAEAGRNRPLLVTVETADGAEHEVFLKVSARPELGIEGLSNELLAACLAGDLGLPINEPLLVELLPEWIGSIPDREVRAVLEQSATIAFASNLPARSGEFGPPPTISTRSVDQALCKFSRSTLTSTTTIGGRAIRIVLSEAIPFGSSITSWRFESIKSSFRCRSRGEGVIWTALFARMATYSALA